MIAKLLMLLITGYQRTLSRLFGNLCRFEPSCSRYMFTCIERFGALHGVRLGLLRLARCHPWNEGGDDPPPHSLHRDLHPCCDSHASGSHHQSLP